MQNARPRRFSLPVNAGTRGLHRDNQLKALHCKFDASAKGNVRDALQALRSTADHIFTALAGAQARAKDVGADAQWPNVSLDEPHGPAKHPGRKSADPSPIRIRHSSPPSRRIDRLMGLAAASPCRRDRRLPRAGRSCRWTTSRHRSRSRSVRATGTLGRHQLCLCQREPQFRQSDLDARLARLERAQRGGFREDRSSADRPVRQGPVGRGHHRHRPDRGSGLPCAAVQILRHHKRRQNGEFSIWHDRRRLGLFAGARHPHRLVRRLSFLARERFGVRSPLQRHRHLDQPCAGRAAALPISFDTGSLRYEPTMHAVRLGFEGRFAITDRWSFSGEVAVTPYVFLQNADSHLLRQSPADLGPAPNVVTKSTYAFGLEAEIFFNYAITPNIEVGAGARYWGVGSNFGGVRFGPSFDTAIRSTALTSSVMACCSTSRASSDRKHAAVRVIAGRGCRRVRSSP